MSVMYDICSSFMHHYGKLFVFISEMTTKSITKQNFVNVLKLPNANYVMEYFMLDGKRCFFTFGNLQII